MTSPFSLAGKRIVVTGANTGIGQGIAVSIARAGGSVVGVGRSPMTETARIIEAGGGTFTGVQGDLGDVQKAVTIINDIWDGIGTIDGLVNNAGIIRRADALDFSLEDWDEVMDVNLRSVFFMSQAFAKRLVAEDRRGKIVNIASMLSFQGGIRVASYTASKSGLVGITRLLACEWAQRSINVNAIAPGYIVSNNTEALRNDPDRNRQFFPGSLPGDGESHRILATLPCFCWQLLPITCMAQSYPSMAAGWQDKG